MSDDVVCLTAANGRNRPATVRILAKETGKSTDYTCEASLLFALFHVTLPSKTMTALYDEFKTVGFDYKERSEIASLRAENQDLHQRLEGLNEANDG